MPTFTDKSDLHELSVEMYEQGDYQKKSVVIQGSEWQRKKATASQAISRIPLLILLHKINNLTGKTITARSSYPLTYKNTSSKLVNQNYWWISHLLKYE